jgi:hypothetical protein
MRRCRVLQLSCQTFFQGVKDTDFEDKFMFVVHDPMLIDGFLCDTSYVEELKKLNYYLDNKVYPMKFKLIEI